MQKVALAQGMKVRAPTPAQPKSGLQNPNVGAAGHPNSGRRLLEQSRTHLCSNSNNSSNSRDE